MERAKKLLGLNQAAVTAVEVKLGDLLPDCPPTLDKLTSGQLGRLDQFFVALGDNDVVSAEIDDGQLPDLSMRLDVPTPSCGRGCATCSASTWSMWPR